jgi:hypothetical protein
MPLHESGPLFAKIPRSYSGELLARLGYVCILTAGVGASERERERERE